MKKDLDHESRHYQLHATRRRSDVAPEATRPLPCLIEQLEVVATIGPGFTLVWAPGVTAQGLKVGDNLMAFIRPEPNHNQPEKTDE